MSVVSIINVCFSALLELNFNFISHFFNFQLLSQKFSSLVRCAQHPYACNWPWPRTISN